MRVEANAPLTDDDALWSRSRWMPAISGIAEVPAVISIGVRSTGMVAS
jgi:hypothetical protein